MCEGIIIGSSAYEHARKQKVDKDDLCNELWVRNEIRVAVKCFLSCRKLFFLKQEIMSFVYVDCAQVGIV